LNNQNNKFDPSRYGAELVEEEIPEEVTASEEEQNVPEFNPSKYGAEETKPPKEKVGKFKSALYGLAEGVLGIPARLKYEIGEVSKPIDEMFYGKDENPKTFEEENPILNAISSFPESKDEASRRIRVGFQTLPVSVVGGIPGIIAGLVGSQAGQTIREVFGKEGKFDEFGWGEGAAMAADVLGGVGAGVTQSLIRGSRQATAQQVPAAFRQGGRGLQGKVVKNAIQQEKHALDEVVNNFSGAQLQVFEEEAAQISQNSYTQITQSGAGDLKRNADNMFRNTQLSIISPISATPDQAGRAIQDAANVTFRNEVLGAERAAYSAARESAEGVSGQAPRTIAQAKALRANLTRVEPTPEQKPLIAFLDNLIADLETNTPASTTPASKLLDSSGKPLVGAVEHEAVTEATTRSANELVDMVQNANQTVNYGAELREQSHRLIPIVDTFREEVGQVLSKKPEAATLFGDANRLHARNAEVWGTNYMRNVRFAENPESIITASTKASNMRNLKQGIQNPEIQGVAERAVVDNLTATRGAASSRRVVDNISPELSPTARGAAEELINVKDPLTTTGGRAAVRNDILKDAAQSVNTGKRPEVILDLMQTPKGYQIVRESMQGSPQSRQLFQTFERLFMEDVVSSVVSPSGVIDFKKARNIIKNPEMREVLSQIGNGSALRRFEQLERLANNFERNIALYSMPETQSLFQGVAKETGKMGMTGAILHALHIPWPVIAGLGLGKTGIGGLKISYRVLEKKLLSNPRAVHYLERVSEATTPRQLAKQLPRLVAELQKGED